MIHTLISIPMSTPSAVHSHRIATLLVAASTYRLVLPKCNSRERQQAIRNLCSIVEGSKSAMSGASRCTTRIVELDRAGNLLSWRKHPNTSHMRILAVHMIRYDRNLDQMSSYRLPAVARRPKSALPALVRDTRTCATHPSSSPSAPSRKCCHPVGCCRSTNRISCRSPW